MASSATSVPWNIHVHVKLYFAVVKYLHYSGLIYSQLHDIVVFAYLLPDYTIFVAYIQFLLLFIKKKT